MHAACRRAVIRRVEAAATDQGIGAGSADENVIPVSTGQFVIAASAADTEITGG